MSTLVTGSAGFIGAYVTRVLLARGEQVGWTTSTPIRPPLKRDRIQALCPEADIRALDLTDRDGLPAIRSRPECRRWWRGNASTSATMRELRESAAPMMSTAHIRAYALTSGPASSRLPSAGSLQAEASA